jgi:hypothetical protein
MSAWWRCPDVQDWSRVLLDALKMLILDLPAEHARPVRRLRPVG